MNHSFPILAAIFLLLSACGETEPTITKIEPVFGLTRGGEKAVISGANLDTLEPITVYWGNNKVRVSSLQNSDELWVTTPPNDKEGLVDIRIIAQNRVEFLIEDAFEYVQESKMAECVNVSKALNGTPVIEQKSQR